MPIADGCLFFLCWFIVLIRKNRFDKCMSTCDVCLRPHSIQTIIYCTAQCILAIFGLAPQQIKFDTILHNKTYIHFTTCTLMHHTNNQLAP